MFNDQGYGFALGGFNTAGTMAGQQGAHLAGMINQTQDAIAAENQSRVAQERERRRMEHEKELMRMQLEQQRLNEEGNRIRALLASM